MNFKHFGLLISLAALWGASFLFIRVASPALGPLFLMDIRVIIAALVLLVYSKVIKHDFSFKANWKKYLFLGAVNAGIPFTLIATAALKLTASLAAILNSTTPLFTALVASIWLRDKLGIKKAVGIVLGLIGVVIIVGWNPISPDSSIILSASLSILAAFSYGVGNVFARKYCKDISSLDASTGQLIGASIILFPLAVVNLPTEWPDLNIIFSVVTLAIFCTSVALIIYFYLIKSVGPTKAASALFLVPVFGTIWGMLLLGETINLYAFLGLIFILVGISLIYEVQLFKKKVKVTALSSK